jgi:DNA polymerase III epsilon subunit family exonuclease
MTSHPLLLIFIVVITLFLFFRYFVKKKGGKQRIPETYLPDSFIVIDLETTGLKPEHDEIIEIAAIKHTKGEINNQFIQGLVKPRQKIPAKITKITGITQEMVDRDGETLEKAFHDLLEFIGDLRLVTFNAEFDMAFLQAAAETLGRPRLINPVSCALKMARRAFPKRKGFKLVDLASDGQIADGNQAHRALEDARRALIVYTTASSILKSCE